MDAIISVFSIESSSGTITFLNDIGLSLTCVLPIRSTCSSKKSVNSFLAKNCQVPLSSVIISPKASVLMPELASVPKMELCVILTNF